MRQVALRAVTGFLFSSVVLAHGGCVGGTTLPAKWVVGPLPIREPSWVPLSVPQSAVTLPAFMVGNKGDVLSSGGWQPATPTSVSGAGVMAWDETKQAKLDAGLQAKFKKFLVD